MGLGDVSMPPRIIEPKQHGKLVFDFHLQYPVDTPEWFDLVVEQIKQSTEEGPVLCATGSHKLARELGERITEATIRTPEETTAEAANRMGNSQILIAAGAWAGLDTHVGVCSG